MPPVEDMPGGAAASVPSAWRVPNSRMLPVDAYCAGVDLCDAASALVVFDLSAKPAGERAYGSGPRTVAVGRAVVVDQPRLDDGVAHGGMVAARQYMVVAQQVLAIVGVLDQRAQRAAATVDNLIAVDVVVVVVAA